jgi:hypothetical protein
MRRRHLLIVLISAVICFAGCKKIPVIPENMSKAITSKKWKLTGYTENNVDKLTETYAPCELDNIDIYMPDGSYIIDEGLTKCNDDDEQLQVGAKWKIKGNKLTISYENDDYDMELEVQFEILEVSATTLRYTIPNLDGPGMLIFTCTAQ